MNNRLGYNIQNALSKKSVSVCELANRLNCDRSSLSRRLLEPQRIRVEEMIKIGAAIGVNWRDLLEGVE